MTQPWLTGRVVRGDGRGRGLGFPTANIELYPPQQRPTDGIYACWAQLDDQRYQAVAHSGPRPMFPGVPDRVEIHLLNFPDRDLYDKRLSFSCVQKLRDSQKFNSTSDLIAAIKKDCDEAKKFLFKESNIGQ